MKIAIVAPAGCVDETSILNAKNALEKQGVECQIGANVFAQHRYFAGSVEQRIADLKHACEDERVTAIWCARGGTGAAQLLPFLGDWLLSKPLVGYSDITVLLNWLAMRGGRGLHAPVLSEITTKNLTTDAISADGQAVLHCLAGPNQAVNLARQPNHYPLIALNAAATRPQSYLHVLGGNLATLSSLQGTVGAVQLRRPSALLLEDVGESFYRLERMLVQLLQSIDVSQLKAVVLGDFYQCPQKNVPHALADIFAEHLNPLGIALYRGDWFGHGAQNRPFWLGDYADFSNIAMQYSGNLSGVLTSAL